MHIRPRSYLGRASKKGAFVGWGTVHVSERSTGMRFGNPLLNLGGDKRRQAATRRLTLTLERLEDRTVPSTTSPIANLAPAINNVTSAAAAMSAAPASPSPTAAVT